MDTKRIEAESALADSDMLDTVEAIATVTAGEAVRGALAAAIADGIGSGDAVTVRGTGGAVVARQATAEAVNLTACQPVVCMFAGALRAALAADGTTAAHIGVTVEAAQRLVLVTLASGDFATMSIGTFGRYAIASGDFEARTSALLAVTVRAAKLASPAPRAVLRKWYRTEHPSAPDA